MMPDVEKGQCPRCGYNCRVELSWKDKLEEELYRCFSNGKGGYIIDDSDMSRETLYVIVGSLLTTQRTELAEQVENLRGFIITKSIGGGAPEDFYMLIKEHVLALLQEPTKKI